ncbi:MAG: carbon-nitrogen hydrolase family protein, partial [Pseudomonadota bacterium]
ATDNVQLLCDEIRTVKKRFPWVHMVMIPELAAHDADTKKAEPMPGPTETAFANVARETGLWVIPGSIYEKNGPAIFNTTPVINPQGEVILRYRKIYPFLPYEKGITGGEELGLFDIPGIGKFGISICYDMWFPEVTRNLVAQGAEVILHPSLTNTIDRDIEISIARTNAACNQCYFLDANSAGKLAFGRSVIAGPGGEVIHQAGSTREIIALELDLNTVRTVRERGWHGLGQPLKSFRDSHMKYPVYQGNNSTDSLSDLGPLTIPNQYDSSES